MEFLRKNWVHFFIATIFYFLGYMTSKISLRNYTTGGDSYCYLKLEEANPKTNEVRLKLIHKGEYSLYDLYINFYFLNDRGEYEEKPRDSIDIGNVVPNTVRDIPLSIGKVNKQSVKVSFLVRNGNYNQYFWFSKVSGGWLHQTYVEREGKKTDYRKDKNFSW